MKRSLSGNRNTNKLLSYALAGALVCLAPIEIAYSQTKKEILENAISTIEQAEAGADITSALDELFLLVDSGDIKSKLFLGRLYYAGEKVTQDKQLGKNLLREAAMLGSTPAISEIADAYFADGEDELAIGMLDELSADGNVKAIQTLAELYLDEEQGYFDLAKSKSYLDQLLVGEQDLTNLKTPVQTLAAKIYAKTISSDDAIDTRLADLEKLKVLADAKNWIAIKEFSDILIGGLYGVEADPILGYDYIIGAANDGIKGAYIPLAEAYLKGDVLTRNVPGAIALLEKARRKPLDRADLTLAEFTLSGDYDGLTINEAQEKLIQAYEQTGSAKIAVLLSKNYQSGTFGEPDIENALKYSKLAADEENNSAIRLKRSQILRFGSEEELAALVGELEVEAGAGNLDAASSLVKLYGTGERVPQDTQKAENYLNTLALSGEPDALLEAGKLLVKGQVVNEDVGRGFAYIERAHEQGLDNASLEYAKILVRGEITTGNIPLAVEIYEKLHENGNQVAAVELGKLYLKPGAPYTDISRGISLIETTLKTRPDAKNALLVSRAYFSGVGVDQNTEKAVEYTKLAADLGETRAKKTLGDLYMKGDFVPQNFRLAKSYYEEAAEAGDERSQLALGDLLLRTRRNQEAIQIFQTLADSGNETASVRIASAYLSGARFPGRFNEGITGLQQLSESGNAEASLKLAQLYRDGHKNLPQDFSRSLFFYDAAMNSGDENAGGDRLVLLATINNAPEDLANLKILYSELGDKAQRRFIGRGFRAVERTVAVLVQEKLNELGFYNGPLDGLFGRGSSGAMRAFCLQDAANGPCDTPEWSSKNAVRVMMFEPSA